MKRLPLLLCGLICASSSLAAGTLTGTVGTIEGKPIAGAMVTIWNADKNRKESVYTDAEGKYVLNTSFAGKLQVRARTPYFKDVVKEIELADKQALKLDLGVEKIASVAAILNLKSG